MIQTCQRLLVLGSLLAVIGGCGADLSAQAVIDAAQPEAPAALGDVVQPGEDGRLEFGDAITLENGSITLKVSPMVGRIVWLSAKDSENLLWIAGKGELAKGLTAASQPKSLRTRPAYANYGGDKIWPTVQALWPSAYGGSGGWPPDGIVDGEPWTVVGQPSAREVIIRSAVQPQLGILIERRITVAAEGPSVRIQTALHKVQAGLFPVHVWSVSQVRKPEFVLTHTVAEHERPPSEQDRAWVPFGAKAKAEKQIEALSPQVHAFSPHGFKGGLKIGTLGEWLAGVDEEHVFVHRIAFEPESSYADGSNIQVYADGNYVELETLSPTLSLKVGESVVSEVAWHVWPREGRTAAELAEWLPQVIAEQDAVPRARVLDF